MGDIKRAYTNGKRKKEKTMAKVEHLRMEHSCHKAT